MHLALQTSGLFTLGITGNDLEMVVSFDEIDADPTADCYRACLILGVAIKIKGTHHMTIQEQCELVPGVVFDGQFQTGNRRRNIRFRQQPLKPGLCSFKPGFIIARYALTDLPLMLICFLLFSRPQTCCFNADNALLQEFFISANSF